MKLKWFLFLLLFACFLSSCINTNSSNVNKNGEEPTSALEEIATQTPGPTHTVTVTPTKSPTETEKSQSARFPERIIQDAKCGDESIKGHILFLHNTQVNDRRINYLYIMDGNGCNPKLIMEDVYGAPDWSIDGKRIAIGCENGKNICILSADSIFEACYQNDDNDCKPEIINKYTAPGPSDKGDIGYISWSYTNDKLLVETVDYQLREGVYPLYQTYLLDLKNGGKWTLLLDGYWGYSEFSPTDDSYILSRNCLFRRFYLDQTPNKYYFGCLQNAVFSPDGKRITFLNPITEDFLEPYTIGERDEETLPLYEIIYSQVKYDNTWDRENLIFLEPSVYRVLCWSPYDRYLAFIEGGWESRIMRLDNETGEVVNLTNNMGFDENTFFFNLRWGP